jgi:hypothetical protein
MFVSQARYRGLLRRLCPLVHRRVSEPSNFLHQQVFDLVSGA